MKTAACFLAIACYACAAAYCGESCTGKGKTGVCAGQDATLAGEAGPAAGIYAKTPAAPASTETTALIATLKAARDEDATLAVIRKLVARDEKGVGEALQAAIDREKDEAVKSRMVGEIAKGATPQITDLLIGVYRKGDTALFTGPAVDALVKIQGDKMAGILAEGVKRQYTECSAAAVADGLKTRKEKVVADALLAALDDCEATWLTARAHVLLALGGRNEPRITTVLLENLQDTEDEGIKEACAQALALEGGEKVTAALVKTLQTADEYLLREVAALSLGRRGEAQNGQTRTTIVSTLKKAQAVEKQDRVKKAIAKSLTQIEKAK